jgi:hypothetical protein
MVLEFYDIDVLHSTHVGACTKYAHANAPCHANLFFGNETLTSIKRGESERVLLVCFAKGSSRKVGRMLRAISNCCATQCQAIRGVHEALNETLTG